MSAGNKIVCIGADPTLLETRCLVLDSAGFDASYALLANAIEILSQCDIDIVIISAAVSKQERAAITAAVANGARIIQLSTFVSPVELLELLRA